MTSTVQTISLAHLSLAFVPVALVVAVLYRWSGGHLDALHGLSRMLVQLLLVGYFLSYLFAAEHACGSRGQVLLYNIFPTY